MDNQFRKPPGLIGRFAVVKLWPKIRAAEDENVARMKLTAKSLGLECVEITPDGRALNPPHELLTQSDIDFVIHLHFETPKAYNVFSFVALWNPVQFYHDWGYRRFSRHLLTHDDFLSCSATGTDDHIGRLIASDPTRLGPCFTMYHSLSEPILEPTLGERKIFYAGINWERLGKKKGRHQEILDRLDQAGDIRIFGPKIFQGVNVWEGYQTYSGQIPFDGVSVMREINRCGIALVLSSDAHKESELMSNRLFESLAGGAFVICDENPFAAKFFGDCLLYIDGRQPPDVVYAAVTRHIDWIKSNPDKALEMARKAQAIFREKFSLDKSLADIYTNFSDRRKRLEKLYSPADPKTPAVLFFMMPRFDQAVLNRHLASFRTQRHAGCRAILLADRADLKENGGQIADTIRQAGVEVTVVDAAFFEDGRRRRIGLVFSEAIPHAPADALICFVAPDEELFSDHIQSLAGALERDAKAGVAYSNLIYRHQNEGTTYHDLQEELDCVSFASHRPLGYSRFLLRRSAFDSPIDKALRHLDAKAMALTVAACPNRAATKRASVVCDIQSAFNVAFAPNVPVELEIMRDYCPELAPPSAAKSDPDRSNDDLAPIRLSFKRLSDMDKQTIAVELAHSIPLPSLLRKIVFGGYRFWLRRSK
ncbi:MAG TPA: glycosyltransferase [Tepidisphaeraceae bacterium]|nr:glycosyltransferase [Tepidisphaeraceae bacterium]